MIGAYDIQIAAIALANSCMLVTHNTGEFSRVSGLTVDDWLGGLRKAGSLSTVISNKSRQ